MLYLVEKVSVTGPGKVYVQSMPMSKMFGALGSTNK